MNLLALKATATIWYFMFLLILYYKSVLKNTIFLVYVYWLGFEKFNRAAFMTGEK